jgi:3-polyprenyl-4-hydroxybenzoate decarboxylase
MAFDSFRDFLNRLEAAGELKRFPLAVASELEITEIADREMKSPGGGKALLFEKPTVNGEVSPFPLAINALGSERRMAMSLGANFERKHERDPSKTGSCGCSALGGSAAARDGTSRNRRSLPRQSKRPPEAAVSATEVRRRYFS